MLGEKEDNDFQRNGKVILGKISVNEISRDDKHAATLFNVSCGRLLYPWRVSLYSRK